MACQNTSYAELNTNYLTLIRFLIANLTQLVNQAATMNQTSFSSFVISAPIKHYLDLLFESERLLRSNIMDLCSLYFSNYEDYSNNLMNSKMGFIGAMFAVAFFVTLFYAYLLFYVKI